MSHLLIKHIASIFLPSVICIFTLFMGLYFNVKFNHFVQYMKDGIIGTGFTLLSKITKKLNKLHKTKSCPNIKHQAIRDEMRSTIASAYCLETWENHVDTSRLWVWRQSQDCGESRTARSEDQKRAKQITPKMCREPPKMFSKCWTAYVYESPISPPLRKSMILLS